MAAKDLVGSHRDPEGGLKSSDRDVCSVGVRLCCHLSSSIT